MKDVFNKLAITGFDKICNGSDELCEEAKNKAEAQSTITNAISVAMYIVGALAVIMIIFGGILYVTAAGDEAKMKKARYTIIYSLVGLVVAILALTITNFIVERLA